MTGTAAAGMPTGTVTFLFTDIEGSTRLWQGDPDAMAIAQADHDRIMRDSIDAHSGYVFSSSGDGLGIAFSTPQQALTAALDAQLALASNAWPDGSVVTVRMGLHTGAAEARDGDYFGHEVNKAARVMAAGHGGQVLLSSLTAELVRAGLDEGLGLSDLGDHRLKDIEEMVHLFQLAHPVLRAEFPPLKTGRLHVADLPAPLDTFVGRGDDLAEVSGLLDSARLVTLLGPGGTGKTRLALQVAGDRRDELGANVGFVDLTPYRDTDSALSAVARTLGVREKEDSRLVDALAAEIDGQQLLLVLDNFEQVTEAGPSIAELLRDCPQLSVLVTSRQALHVTGEQVVPLAPLGLPASDGGRGPIDEVARSEAVRLFLDRARAVKPDFELTEANVDAVVELCRRLDGLPLAIELAAARLTLLSPEALVERLGNRLKLLRGGSRDAPERQQTLRGTIDWSYELLDGDEQLLFQVLSLFSGATLDAVEAVIEGLPGVDEVDVFDVLASLVDKSLVRRVDTPDGPRLLMLETIREFAVTKLAEDAAFHAAATRAHATFFCELAERERDALAGDDREMAAARVVADLDNIRAAWDFWVGEVDFEELSKLADSLWPLYDMRSWYHATVQLVTDLLEVLSSTPDTPERLVAQITLQTSLARLQLGLRGYTEEVEEAYRRALHLVEGQPDVPELLPVLRGLSSLYVYRAEFDKAFDVGERMLRLAQQYGDAAAEVEGHLVIGASKAMMSELEDGRRHLESGIASYDATSYAASRYRLGNNPAVVCFTTSALTLWLLGFPDRARERAAEGVALAEQVGHPTSIAYANFHAGLLFLWCRANAEAERCAAEVIAIADDDDFPIWRAVASCLRGAAVAGLGAPEEGMAILDEGMVNYRELRTPPVFLPMLLQMQAVTSGLAGRPGERLAQLDQAIEFAAQGEGATLTAELLRVRGELQLETDGDVAEAENWLRAALDSATEAGSPILQLRAATSLARLLVEQGRSAEARPLLAPILESFTEGFGLADLVEARALVDELG